MQNFKFKQCEICSGTLYNNIKLGHNHLCPKLKTDSSLLNILCRKQNEGKKKKENTRKNKTNNKKGNVFGQLTGRTNTVCLRELGELPRTGEIPT